MAGEDSGIKLVHNCEACGHLRYSSFSDPGKLIVPQKWDGSDLFMVWPLPRYIFVSERLKSLVSEERLKGCEIVPVESLENSPLVSEGYSPGRLSHHMPEDRAHELGDALDIF